MALSSATEFSSPWTSQSYAHKQAIILLRISSLKRVKAPGFCEFPQSWIESASLVNSNSCMARVNRCNIFPIRAHTSLSLLPCPPQTRCCVSKERTPDLMWYSTDFYGVLACHLHWDLKNIPLYSYMSIRVNKSSLWPWSHLTFIMSARQCQVISYSSGGESSQ